LNNSFFDFPIYTFPQHDEIKDIPGQAEKKVIKLLILINDPSNSAHLQKVKQIQKAMRLQEGDFHIDNTKILGNVVENGHDEYVVKHVLVFGGTDQNTSLHSVQNPGKLEVLYTATVGQLIEEEKNGQTSLRRELWLALQNWKLS